MIVNLIWHGLNMLEVDVPEGTTVGQILGNKNYAAALNFDVFNVEGLIAGTKAETDTILYPEDTLQIAVARLRSNSNGSLV